MFGAREWSMAQLMDVIAPARFLRLAGSILLVFKVAAADLLGEEYGRFS